MKPPLPLHILHQKFVSSSDPHQLTYTQECPLRSGARSSDPQEQKKIKSRDLHLAGGDKYESSNSYYPYISLLSWLNHSKFPRFRFFSHFFPQGSQNFGNVLGGAVFVSCVCTWLAVNITENAIPPMIYPLYEYISVLGIGVRKHKYADTPLRRSLFVWKRWRPEKS